MGWKEPMNAERRTQNVEQRKKAKLNQLRDRRNDPELLLFSVHRSEF